MTTVSGAGVVVTGGGSGTEAGVAQLAAAMDAGRFLVLPHPDGLIRPLVSERLSFADVPGALRRLGAGKTTGRLVFLP
jgi:hypothetical protein